MYRRETLFRQHCVQRACLVADWEFSAGVLNSNLDEKTNSRLECEMTSSLPTHTSSPRALDLAKRWLNECHCSQSRTSAWAPTRLLDIGDAKSQTWTLCIPNEDEVRIRQYVTLSYRWGNQPFIQLTVDVLQAFRAGMPICDLPQTFQDAIAVTRHFGIRYLWVDALCVMQDSEDDIAAECSVMSTIYTNSACNLAATSSEDPFGGLFRKRNFEGASVGNIHPAWTNLGGKYQPLKLIDTILSDGYFGNEIHRSPLRRRGWILQEMLLAPNQLHFGEHQLYWECGDGEKCETFPRGLTGRLTFSGSRHLLRWDAEGAAQEWKKIVRIYSRCALSRPSDKLLALSGLAQRFQKGTGDIYLAGLWKSHLPHTLHWEVFRPEGRGKQAQQYRAPTWTWASIDGPIWFQTITDRHESVLVDVLHCKVETGLDPTGVVHGGQLTIRAPARMFTSINDGIMIRDFAFYDTKIHTKVCWDDIDTVLWDKEHSLVVTKVNATCIDFLHKGTHELNGPSDWLICGIVLTSSGEASKSIRVGSFDVSFHRIHKQSTQSPQLEYFGLQIVDEYEKVTVKDSSLLRTYEII
jgi:Heterokaryon incompatibility protein (HET)